MAGAKKKKKSPAKKGAVAGKPRRVSAPNKNTTDSVERANWKKAFVVHVPGFDTPLRKLARHTVKESNTALRKTFCVGDFNKAFDQELASFPTVLEDLTADERAFCEGWLLLARLACQSGNPNNEIDDGTFVNFVNRQLSPPWPHVETG